MLGTPSSTQLGMNPYFLGSTGSGTFLPHPARLKGMEHGELEDANRGDLTFIGLEISNQRGFNGTVNLDTVAW
jgi:hypothetical protein